ncbi:hypothetical protein DF223_08440 [Mycetocola zhujimingii]|uniref:Uncharacterized protein n=1 Tax=Mycetocola zhujimingii TaxID=2079792 RepID=A0A2U1TDM1_9MICO|nr:hypothetical protein DF223_08440 [Mycetocola zhujimingii]
MSNDGVHSIGSAAGSEFVYALMCAPRADGNAPTTIESTRERNRATLQAAALHGVRHTARQRTVQHPSRVNLEE